MAFFPRNDKKLELPISRDSRYHPKVRYGLPLRIGHKLKSMLVTLIMIACTIYLLRYLLDRGEVVNKVEDIHIELEPSALPELEEPEYYNYEFRPVDMEKVGKFDEGFQHYILNKEGAVISNAEELYKEDLEMLLATSVEQYDLSEYTGSTDGAVNREHVLICIPLRDAEQVLPLMFKHIMNLTYPHELIDLAFLVSDCSIDDNTFERLLEYSTALQTGTLAKFFEDQDKLSEQAKLKNEADGGLYLKYMDKDYLDRVKDAFTPPFHDSYSKPFRSVQIFKKDFGQVIGQGFSDRHHVKVQGSRRKLMGKARNWLTANALKPYHTWVYWRDADVELCPGTVIQDLMSTGYDVIVPNVWRPLPTFLGGKQGYDLNSWIESREALALAETLDEDDVIVEGYAEYATWRYHLASEREDNGELTVLDLDGVGGVSILAKAKLFRSGVHFPAFAFENHAETEAFGKMAKKMGYKVGGLPHYTLWHIYEPSDEDLREVAIMEREGKRS